MVLAAQLHVSAPEVGACYSFPLYQKMPNDSLQKTEKSQLVTKSPKGAMLRSLALPGWGQFYNKQIIKSLLVVATQGTFIGLAIRYNNKVQTALSLEEQNFYKDRRNLTFWWMGAAVLLSMIDAYIDAHLYDFDAGPDLALRVGGINQGGEQVGFWGLSLRANF